MSKFDGLWQQLARKDARLLNPDSVVTFKAANLRKLLDQFYEQGRKASGSGYDPNDPLSEILRGIKR